MVDREQSEFNMAVSYLNRLNALFYASDEAAIGLDAFTWFHCLMALFRELSTEMKDEEIKSFKTRADTIRPLVDIFIREQAKGNTNLPAELHTALQDYELGLRRVMRESGLQLKMAEDAKRALR